MKFSVQTILSLSIDGASSHLLIFNNIIKILLDCGISHSFNFQKYLQKKQQLKTVCLVLISHSQLEYSGAIAFLIDQLGLDPRIFYTTQSIVRYAAFNLHQSLLPLRCKAYSRKIYTKLYKNYQAINIIKPQQKKSFTIGSTQNSNPNQPQKSNQSNTMETQQQKPAIGQVQKTIYFTCFSGGGNMCSLSWRLSYGIVNILYLVQYNNYSMYHINGLDIPQIMQPTDILITDTYRMIDDMSMKKIQIYQRVKNILINFYQRNGVSFVRPSIISNLQVEKKILFVCYPNQMLVEIMAVVNKILEDIQPPEGREKIRVIHLSSKFLQLIKTQMDYFSTYFKDTLQNIEQYFMHSKNISGRINLATLQSLSSLLYDSIDKSVQIYHIGQQANIQILEKARVEGEVNVMKFNIMNIQDKLTHSTSKICIEENQGKEQIQGEKGENNEMEEQKMEDVLDEVEGMREETQAKLHQPLYGKYFSRIGFFPRFASKQMQQQNTFDQYGARHEYQRFEQRKTIDVYKKELQLGLINRVQFQKKHSSIQVMNIQFKIPQSERINILQHFKINTIVFNSCRTNFNSSIQLIMVIKPDNIILINTDQNSKQGLGYKYTQLFNKSIFKQSSCKKIDIFDLNVKKGICHLFIQNQLISYKINYIPIPQQRKLQKVKGVITYSGVGLLEIHLDCLEEKQHLEFRLDKFYKKIKNLQIYQCIFTKKGIVIDGVRIYREDKVIILQGEYSEEYFKVRRLLYDFLKMD